MTNDGKGTTSRKNSSLVITSEGKDGDVANRRSKNRVNARRSRELKKHVLDNLQQSHWKLHQENRRLKVENDKIREAIGSIKALHQLEKAPPTKPRPANLLIAELLSGFPRQGLQQQPVAAPRGHPGGNTIVELLAQHLAMQHGRFPDESRRDFSFSTLPAAQPQEQAPAPELQAPNQDDLRALLLDLMSSEMNRQQSLSAPTPVPMPAMNSQAQPNNGLAALATLLSRTSTQSGIRTVLLQGLGNIDGMHGFQKAGSVFPSQAQQVPSTTGPYW